jgi:hypothetical protein
MRGDAILRTTLIEAIYALIGTKELQELVVSYECNDSLFRRYKHMATIQKLPPGLPMPTGEPNADATRFEAWICETYMEYGSDMRQVGPIVLNAIGFQPGGVRGGV